MPLVRQAEEAAPKPSRTRPGRRRALGSYATGRGTGRVRRALVCALAAALLSGCAQSVDPIERMGRKAAQKVRHHAAAGRADAAGGPGVPGAPGAPARATTVPPVDAHRRWGLAAPLAPAPAPPARRIVRPRTRGTLPRVVGRVPTRDKVVFLVLDENADEDPRFVDLVRDLRLPVSVFLTRAVAGPGRDGFGRLRALGAGIGNRTLTHPFLPGLGHVGQHAEICGQQERLKDRFGVAPRLLRPPYDAYDAETLRAAGDCGIDAIVLGRPVADTGRLRPGDIVPAEAHGGTTLTEVTVRLLRRVQGQGLTVGRLEDYL
ncbi:polysaccharide deacetylase family protein [Streptomyces sp. NPDC102406]|uniref:polysaccharide deacetylase family protein n=1 Tax=Streptomyces sp. NPDC102406 TaxID=3366171 RepID=UPI00382386EA